MNIDKIETIDMVKACIAIDPTLMGVWLNQTIGQLILITGSDLVNEEVPRRLLSTIPDQHGVPRSALMWNQKGGDFASIAARVTRGTALGDNTLCVWHGGFVQKEVFQAPKWQEAMQRWWLTLPAYVQRRTGGPVTNLEIASVGVVSDYLPIGRVAENSVMTRGNGNGYASIDHTHVPMPRRYDFSLDMFRREGGVTVSFAPLDFDGNPIPPYSVALSLEGLDRLATMVDKTNPMLMSARTLFMTHGAQVRAVYLPTPWPVGVIREVHFIGRTLAQGNPAPLGYYYSAWGPAVNFPAQTAADLNADTGWVHAALVRLKACAKDLGVRQLTWHERLAKTDYNVNLSKDSTVFGALMPLEVQDSKAIGLTTDEFLAAHVKRISPDATEERRQELEARLRETVIYFRAIRWADAARTHRFLDLDEVLRCGDRWGVGGKDEKGFVSVRGTRPIVEAYNEVVGDSDRFVRAVPDEAFDPTDPAFVSWRSKDPYARHRRFLEELGTEDQEALALTCGPVCYARGIDDGKTAPYTQQVETQHEDGEGL